MGQFHKVAKVSDIPPGEMIGVDVSGARLAVANVDGEFFAFDGECTHAAGWLYDGFLEGYGVQCPVHFAEFDVRTGEVKEPPAMLPINVYKVRVVDDDVEVEYPA